MYSYEDRKRALEAIDHGDEDIAATAGAEFVHDPHPEIGPFGLLDPEAENFFVTLAASAVGEERRLVTNHAFVVDFHSQSVGRFERLVLPVVDLMIKAVGNHRSEIGRDIETVDLDYVMLDTPRAYVSSSAVFE